MANGLLDMLGGLGTTPPSYLQGLLGQQETENLRKQSIGTGIANALVGYLATPKNQNLGLGRILANTVIAGQTGAQGVYDNAMQDYQTQAKIAEMKRQQDQAMATREALSMAMQDPRVANDPVAQAYLRSNPNEALKMLSTPRERKTATVGNQVVDTATGEVVFTGEKERKTVNVNAGNKILVTDAVTGETIREIPKGLAPQAPKAMYSSSPIETPNGFVYMPTPEGAASGRLPIDAATGKPVSNLVSTKQLKEQEQQQKAASQKEATADQIGYINDAISGAKNILKSPLSFTSGFVGKTASLVGAPSRTELEGYIDTLKANLSFETLQTMRANSPTGGALGAVSERELALLGSTVASLNPNLPKDVLMKNLAQVEQRYAKIKKALDADLAAMNQQAPSGIPALDAVNQELQRRKGGK